MIEVLVLHDNRWKICQSHTFQTEMDEAKCPLLEEIMSMIRFQETLAGIHSEEWTQVSPVEIVSHTPDEVFANVTIMLDGEEHTIKMRAIRFFDIERTDPFGYMKEPNP